MSLARLNATDEELLARRKEIKIKLKSITKQRLNVTTLKELKELDMLRADLRIELDRITRNLAQRKYDRKSL